MIIKTVLALGGDIKSQWLVAKGNKFFWGPQIGDLSHPDNCEKFKGTLLSFCRKNRLSPHIIAYDLHPGYFSTRLARENKWPAQLIAVQHHHAHIASIMMEHQLKGPVIGVGFDGTGYGTDGRTWGGEFLLVKGAQSQRLAHLQYLKMPGGDKVVKEPWRMVLSILGKGAGPRIQAAGKKDMAIVLAMLSKDINCPLTSSAGRLFDAAAALLGICQVATYEAEGPIKLEGLCRKDLQKSYDFGISKGNGMDVIDTVVIFEAMLKDFKKRKNRSEIATKFHNTMADIIVKTAGKMSKKTGIKDVALSGGVFQNRFLLNKTLTALEKNKFHVYVNQRYPVNDLNIALGQYYVSSHSGKNQKD